jgi:hypothetical protein
LSREGRAAGVKPRRGAGRVLSGLPFALGANKMPAPRLVGGRPQGRQAAEGLLAELMSLPEEQRHDRLRAERFHHPRLLDLLLEAGHAALPGDPERACEILSVAAGLASLLADNGVMGPEIGGEASSRVLCLTGTARRLLGDGPAAEAAFERAGCLPVSSLGRGYFCRALAVLRWDQGRGEEAAALLHHAQRRYAEGQDVREEAACLALLGMLHVEIVEPWRAAPLLREATQGLDAERRPWLAAQCWLGLGFCHAFADQPERARSAREEAQIYYGRLTEEEELLSRWLEGRVATLAGDAEEAGERLIAVWRRSLDQRRLAEATLAAIDLALLWSHTGRGAEVGVLVAEVEASLAGEPGLAVALSALKPMAEDAAAGRPDRELWSGLAQPLRVAFRWQGIGFRPLPFV